MSSKITEKKFRIVEFNNKKLGYYQSGKRRIIGEGHLTEYLAKIERNNTKARIY
jgi:hypothetical protein